MRVVPVYFAADPPAARRFFEALGLRSSWIADSGGWVSMDAAGGGIGLHAAAAADPPRPPGEVELSFESEQPLEVVASRLRDAGFDASIVDESFGRSLRTIDPDGRSLQINEALTDPYGFTKDEV